jgi:hypothetical protein
MDEPVKPVDALIPLYSTESIANLQWKWRLDSRPILVQNGKLFGHLKREERW